MSCIDVPLQVRRALGRKLSAVLSAVLVIYQLGSCAAYLIIVGDSFVPLIDQVAPAGSLLADRRAIITFFALVVILPLCLPRYDLHRALVDVTRCSARGTHSSTAVAHGTHAYLGPGCPACTDAVGDDCCGDLRDSIMWLIVTCDHRLLHMRCRNLSELTLVSTCGVCGFIYVAISICYEGFDVRP